MFSWRASLGETDSLEEARLQLQALTKMEFQSWT